MDPPLYRDLTEEEKCEKVNKDTQGTTDLIPIEQALFALLRDTLAYFHLNTELRVAGGF